MKFNKHTSAIKFVLLSILIAFSLSLKIERKISSNNKVNDFEAELTITDPKTKTSTDYKVDLKSSLIKENKKGLIFQVKDNKKISNSAFYDQGEGKYLIPYNILNSNVATAETRFFFYSNGIEFYINKDDNQSQLKFSFPKTFLRMGNKYSKEDVNSLGDEIFEARKNYIDGKIQVVKDIHTDMNTLDAHEKNNALFEKNENEKKAYLDQLKKDQQKLEEGLKKIVEEKQKVLGEISVLNSQINAKQSQIKHHDQIIEDYETKLTNSKKLIVEGSSKDNKITKIDEAKFTDLYQKISKNIKTYADLHDYDKTFSTNYEGLSKDVKSQKANIITEFKLEIK